MRDVASCECILIGICRPVADHSWAARHCPDGREQDKKVEVDVPQQAIEKPRTFNFTRQHGGDTRPALLCDQSDIELSRRMNNPVNAAKSFADGLRRRS